MSEGGKIIQALKERVEAHPEKPALIYLGARFSYCRLWAWVRSLARALELMGLGPGDRVMIYLPNCPQWAAAWLAILWRGAAAVPVSPIFPARELTFVARDSGAKAIFCTNSNYGYVNQIQDRTGLKQVIHTTLAEPLPAWKRFAGHLLDRLPRGRVARGPDLYSFRGLLKTEPSREPVPTRDSDLATILYTGGTIKTPKGVPYHNEMLWEPFEVQLQVADLVIPRGRNVSLVAAPMFHILGLTFALGGLYLNGETVILLPRLNLDGLLDAVTREKAASLFAGPSLFRMILEHDRLNLYDLSSLKYCFTGGDVFPGRVGQRWRERFGIGICQAYGTTETGGGVSLSPPDRENPLQAVGRVLPEKRLRLVDPLTLRDVPAGAVGELLVSSEPMIRSYWNQPEETAKSFLELEGRLWYRTGDLMRLDETGYLYFIDRVSDAVVNRGQRISVTEIETALQEHPAVTASCVVGVPDAEQGERLKAFVVLKDNQSGLAGQELLNWLARRLPADQVPEYVEFRDALPRSKVGKLLRRELRGEERQRLEKGQWDLALDD
ncbi:MAG: class I adenylate-forming enzyme family protein [Thermodesulfobacteriota bacterium]